MRIFCGSCVGICLLEVSGSVHSVLSEFLGLWGGNVGYFWQGGKAAGFLKPNESGYFWRCHVWLLWVISSY